LAQTESQELAEAAENMAQENARAFEQITNSAYSWLTEYGTAIDAWVNETLEIANSVYTVISAYASMNSEIEYSIELYKAEIDTVKALQRQQRGEDQNTNDLGYKREKIEYFTPKLYELSNNGTTVD
jgi:hypothetical protein